MTDTPAESAEAPRTPEGIARELLEGGLCAHGERNEFRHAYECEVCLPAAIRAALAALNAQWREALLRYEGCAYWIAAEQHSCAKCAPLRALLSEGRSK